MALPFEIRVRYFHAAMERTITQQVRASTAAAYYRCVACRADIFPGDEHWVGKGGRRLCFDCPEVVVVGKVAA